MLRSLLHCMQRQRLELFCLRLRNQRILPEPIRDSTNLCQASRHSSRSRYQINRLNQVLPLQRRQLPDLRSQLLNCSACNTANGYLLHPFTDPPSCVTPATVPSKYGLNDTDSPECTRASKPSVSPARPTHRTALPAISPHRSSSTRSLHLRPAVPPSPAPPGYGVNSADLSRFYPCTDSNCISCAANISNCSACNLANGVLLNSYASVPACIAPGAVPSGYGLNSTDPTRIYPAWMLTAQPALPTPRTARPASWQTDTCSTRTPRFHPPRSLSRNPSRLRSQLERQHQRYPCSEAYCIACSANASNCSACDFALNGYLLDPYLVPPTCVKTPNFPSGYGLNSADYTKVYPAATRTVSHAMPTTRTALPATPRMATSCTPFTDPPSCVTPATVPSKYGLNDTDSSRVYPCLETKCLACKPTHRTALPAISPHRSSSTRSLHLRPAFLHLQLLQATESTRLTSAGSTLVPTRTASAVQPTSRTALRATSQRSPAQLLRQRACLYRSRCSPIRLRSQLD